MALFIIGGWAFIPQRMIFVIRWSPTEVLSVVSDLVIDYNNMRLYWLEKTRGIQYLSLDSPNNVVTLQRCYDAADDNNITAFTIHNGKLYFYNSGRKAGLHVSGLDGNRCSQLRNASTVLALTVYSTRPLRGTAHTAV